MDYKKQHKNTKIHAFCAMGNHFHQATSYTNGSAHLSNYMRYTHGIFGLRYNQRNSRCGKVAQSRPKTPLIQNERHEMQVHFYIEANPIRAGFRKLENLHSYQYSSYGFYAFGKKSKFSHLLTIPNWYLQLGATPSVRQRKYRQLFRAYVGEDNKTHSRTFKQAFIGDGVWILEAREKIKANLAAVQTLREAANSSKLIQSG
jgi:putative transposase